MELNMPMLRKSLHQQGFTLIFTLIILVVMVLSAQAMMVMMRGGTTTAGNVAFRQAAVRVADVAAEDAYAWVNSITSAGTGLEVNSAANPGYYATYNDADPNCRSNATVAFSPKDYNFESDACAMAHTGLAAGTAGAQRPSNATAISGYSLYYVVHRMATTAGACSGPGGCSGPLVTSTCTPPFSQDPSSPNYCKAGVTSTRVYYRITVKVVGSRHNSRYIQTFVY